MMQQKVLYIGALLLICGLVKSDEVNHDNDNYYLNGLSIEQEQPIGSRREGDYYDAYPGQTYATDNQVTVDRQGTLEETALISVIPGIAALLGVIVLAWVQANDQTNQQSEIDSICTTAKEVGDTTLSTATLTTTAGTDAEDQQLLAHINTIITKINSYTTPSC